MLLELVQAGKPVYAIAHEDSTVARYAAEELIRFVERIAGSKMVARIGPADSSERTIWIGRVEWIKQNLHLQAELDGITHDGYIIHQAGQDLILSSHMDRGLLYAVYEVLEQMGCRWVFPGNQGEFIPEKPDLQLSLQPGVYSPAFELRSLTEASQRGDYTAWLEEILELIDWSCKNRINSIFIHENPAGNVKHIDIIIREVKKRGMLFEFGGHGIHHQVDRHLFDQNPELFREVKGERRKDGNFCVSNEDALAMVTDCAVSVITKQPQIDILHLWFDDTYEGSWCQCQDCHSMTPIQQQLRVVNRVAERVGAHRPEVYVDMALYHDTLQIKPEDGSPSPSILGFYAPRERCYAHRIDDPSCSRNVFYYDRLKSGVEVLRNNMYAMEYYTDLILYRKMAIHLPQIISDDLQGYSQAGVSKVSTLVFGRYSWWSYGWNQYIFARKAWNLGFNHEETLLDFCRLAYPSNSREMVDYFGQMEAASRGLLSFCEYTEVYDLRNIPAQKLPFYQKHIQGIGESIRLYDHWLTRLTSISTEGSAAESEQARLRSEMSILKITLLEAQALYEQMAGLYEYEVGDRSNPDELAARLNKAIDYINATREAIQDVPISTKGISGEITFVQELCHDLSGHLASLKPAQHL